MNDPTNIFWDSCVFVRYLTGQPDELVSEIDKYISDAKKGDRRIYFSTIAFVEIRQRALKQSGYGTIGQFFADMGRAFYPIEPNPNVLISAGELRDATPVNPSDAKTQNRRVIGTADAVHLSTCIFARDTLGIRDIVFHTFDNGKGKTWEGKCVPLLTFERWFPETARTPRVNEVCELPRTKPERRQRDLLPAGPRNAGRAIDFN